MRALFLLLLFANIMFLAWSQWIAPPRTMQGHETQSSTGPAAIRLLREAAPPPATTAQSADEGVTCVSAGPYVERSQAEQAAERLARLGFTSRFRESRDEVWVGQWLRITDLATPEDAANALAAVKAAGITDAYVLTDEAPGNVVSLGVFENPGRVEQVAELARKAGFNPQAVDRFRTADVVWVDIDRRANAGLPGIDVLQVGEGPRGRIGLRACPAGPAATQGPVSATP